MLVWSSISLLKKFLAHTWLAPHINKCLRTTIPRVGQITANWPQTSWELMQHMLAARTPVMHVAHSSRRISWHVMLIFYIVATNPKNRRRKFVFWNSIPASYPSRHLGTLGTIHPYIKTSCLLTKTFLSSNFIAGKFLSYTKPGHAQLIGSDLLQAALKKHRTLHYQMFPSLFPYILKAK